MKISLNWLREIINTTSTGDELEKILTNSGLEIGSIEAFESIKGGLNGFVVGEVTHLEKHPNADKLKLTKINVGQAELLNVVCGAPNVEVGQKVVLATVGTTVYPTEKEPFTIQKSKIRGEVSEGMLCSETELGLGNDSSGLLILNDQSIPGTELKNYFEVYTDTILEVELTPNRGDAASHIGVARDVFASQYNNDQLNYQLPSVEKFAIDQESNEFTVDVQNAEACPRYSGILLKNLEVKESPSWLKNRLQAVGLRPINNVVDITNYVMYELGQPLHAFDADQISGKKVVVKTANKDQKFVTLDGVERTLHAEDLMICDVEKPMCIAGVFGGLSAGVKASTTSVFLESACFESAFIRKTSKRHLLYTDASFRYERHTDPNITIHALKRAALLLKEVFGASIHGPIIDIYPAKINPVEINFRFSECKKIIGVEIPKEIIKKILVRLDFEIKSETENALVLLAPTTKKDVTREIDVIEEVIRIYGFNNITDQDQMLTSLTTKDKVDQIHFWKEKISDVLSGNGFYEAQCNSLMGIEILEKAKDPKAAHAVHILNPLSNELNIMRTQLLYNLLQSVAHNHNRNQNFTRLYEFGKTYFKQADQYVETQVLTLCISGKGEKNWKANEQVSDFYLLKSYVSLILSKLGIETDALQTTETEEQNLYEIGIQYSDGKDVLVKLGKVNPSILQLFDIKQEVFSAEINWDKISTFLLNKKWKYKPVNKYPSVKRDLALVLNESVKFEELKKCAFKAEKKLLKEVDIFDVYKGKNLDEGKKSYALRFVLENEQETLKDSDIEAAMNRLLKAFQESFNAVLR